MSTNDDPPRQTQCLKLDPCSPSSTDLKHAASLLQNDQVVAIPTETVYGLAANALSPPAISKIFHAKGRPSDNPLIIHISSLEMLETILPPNTQIPEIYKPLIEKYWPGPLTILLPKGPQIPSSVTAGHKTVAVRFPSHPIAQALIQQCGFPLAAPSANTSGRPSPTLASHVLSDLGGRIPLILDGGPCENGLESTVIDGLSSPPVVLRPGGVTVEMLKKIKGWEGVRVYRKDFVDGGLEVAPTTPGMKYRHYTPEAEVVLFEGKGRDVVRRAIREEVRRIISQSEQEHKIGIMWTSSSIANDDDASEGVEEMALGNTPEAVARELFKALRTMEERGVKIILVEGVGEENEGLAVMNRLRKAAAKVVIV